MYVSLFFSTCPTTTSAHLFLSPPPSFSFSFFYKDKDINKEEKKPPHRRIGLSTTSPTIHIKCATPTSYREMGIRNLYDAIRPSSMRACGCIQHDGVFELCTGGCVIYAAWMHLGARSTGRPWRDAFLVQLCGCFWVENDVGRQVN